MNREKFRDRMTPTCNLDHANAHYYRRHTDINPTGFVPVGPAVDWWAPHDRDGLD